MEAESRMYVGIDLHKKFLMASVFDKNSKMVMEPTRVETDAKQILTFFSMVPEGSMVACESTYNWRFILRTIKKMKYEFNLLNPRQLKVITQSYKKSDRNDCINIANFASKGLLPESYIPNEEIEGLRALTRARMYYVNERSCFKNKIKTILANYGIQKVAYTKEALSRNLRAIEGLTFFDKFNLLKHWHMIEMITPTVYQYDNEIKKLVNSFPGIKKDVKLLMTIPGCGYFYATLIKAEVGDPERFLSSSAFCMYSGIVPSTSASGGKEYHGPLVKNSSKYLRLAFVEMASVTSHARYSLAAEYRNSCGRLAWHAARIKLARKLAKIAIRVLKEQKPYYEEVANKQKIYFTSYERRLKYSKELKAKTVLNGSRPTVLSLTRA